MGVFYVGYNPYTTVNGMLKIGISNHDTPAKRFASLRKTEHFKPVAWMRIDNTTVADLFLVESYVRAYLAKKYTLFGNDHFRYKIVANKDKCAEAIAMEALSLAMQACNLNNFPCAVMNKKYK